MSAEVTELMQRYCDGDAAAFRALYGQVAPRLFGYLLRMVRDRAVADARASYVRGADPTPWIYAIAHRTFLDEARRKKRAVVAVGADDELPEVKAEFSGHAEGAGADADADPELAKAAIAALDALPPQQREAVVLTKLDGKSVAEAAAIAGTTIGAMKVRAHRGYEALRKVLGKRSEPAKKSAGGAS